MEYIKLKNSDLRVSRICLGTWLFGGRRWGHVDDVDSIRTIRAALDIGINFFDTADAYGIGKSEELLGRELVGKRHDIILATKVGVVWQSDGSRYHDLSKKYIVSACDKSLKRLKTDYIDIYQLHEMDPGTNIEETAEALSLLIDSGKIRYAGVSNFSVAVIEELSEKVPLLCTQSEYSLLFRGIERDIIPYCAKANMSLFTYSPLYRGLLTGKFNATSSFGKDDNRAEDPEFSGVKFKKNLQKIKKLAEISSEKNAKPEYLAIQWILKNPIVSSVVVGARTAKQLINNSNALNFDMSEEVYEHLTSIFGF